MDTRLSRLQVGCILTIEMSLNPLSIPGEEWGWIEGKDYMTIDGSVQTNKRDYVQTEFNDANNVRAR